MYNTHKRARAPPYLRRFSLPDFYRFPSSQSSGNRVVMYVQLIGGIPRFMFLEDTITTFILATLIYSYSLDERTTLYQRFPLRFRFETQNQNEDLKHYTF